MATVEELEAQVIALKREVEELTQRFSFHMGYDESQSTLHNPHPNMSISERAGIINDLGVSGDLEVSGDIELTTNGEIRNLRGDRWDQNGFRLVGVASNPDSIIFAYDNGSSITNQAFVTGALGAIQVGMLNQTLNPALVLQNGRAELGFNNIGSNTLGYGALNVEESGVSITGGTARSYGGGNGVLFIGAALVEPTSNPTAGIILYVDGSGNLRARTQNGNVRTVAAV